jgi:hypothetical protein
MQLTLLGIMALGGAVLLIYATLHRRPMSADHTNRRRSDDGKIIYLFNERSGEDEGKPDGGSEAPEVSETQKTPDGEFTDVEFSEVKAEGPNEDGEK